MVLTSVSIALFLVRMRRILRSRLGALPKGSRDCVELEIFLKKGHGGPVNEKLPCIIFMVFFRKMGGINMVCPLHKGFQDRFPIATILI